MDYFIPTDSVQFLRLSFYFGFSQSPSIESSGLGSSVCMGRREIVTESFLIRNC
jgi:hypothetical protein